MSVNLPHETATHAHPELGFFRKYIFSTDHKIIGIQFLFSSLIFLLIGGTLAMLVRIQLGWPHASHAWPVWCRQPGGCRATSGPGCAAT